IRDLIVTGVQTCALPIFRAEASPRTRRQGCRWSERLAPARRLRHIPVPFRPTSRRVPSANEAMTVRDALPAVLRGEVGADLSAEIGRASCRERGWIGGWG